MTGLPQTHALLATLLLAALPRISSAQGWDTAPGGTLTRNDPLGSLVAEALRANPALAATRTEEARAAAEVREARSLYFPTLTLDSRYSRQHGTLNLGDVVNPAYATLNQLTGTQRFPTDLDVTLPMRHESRARLLQPVFNEAIRGNNALAKHRQAVQRHVTDAAARKLAADVQVAWLNAAAARSASAVLEAALRLVQESERVAERLIAAGNTTPEALFRARAERSDVVQQLAESRDRAAAAGRALNQLLGRSLDAPPDTVPDSSLVRTVDISLEQAVAHALAHREELAQLAAGADAADAGVRIANAAFLPSLSVALDYGFQGSAVRFDRNHDFLVATLAVNWTLSTGGRDFARRDAARAEGQRLRIERRDIEEKIRLDVQHAHESALVALDAVTTAEDRLTAARRTYQLVRRRYEEGMAPHIELVDARSALTSAELNRTLTLYRYVTHTVDLERAAALRVID